MDARVQRAVEEAASELELLPGIPAGSCRANVERHVFELTCVTERKGTDVRLFDLGGGAGTFVLAAARLGMQTRLVDDFYDLDVIGAGDETIAHLRDAGVEVIRHDATQPLEIEDEIDVFTSFHTLEHLQASPRALYHQILDALTPGGLFILAGPNAVNLRKRITAPFGGYEWSSMEHWYMQPRFRAHVREPRAQDFEYIARDLGLEGTIVGKNFLGRLSTRRAAALVRLAEPALERWPSLCSDLYLVGELPA